mmetsp:Transcript_21799/g.74947  ORF Transcript_21799/g.74947 Transcript_21799/m.74947 type:complete len:214 (+) Transcript_21799:363-1004(+)
MCRLLARPRASHGADGRSAAGRFASQHAARRPEGAHRCGRCACACWDVFLRSGHRRPRRGLRPRVLHGALLRDRPGPKLRQRPGEHARRRLRRCWQAPLRRELGGERRNGHRLPSEPEVLCGSSHGQRPRPASQGLLLGDRRGLLRGARGFHMWRDLWRGQGWCAGSAGRPLRLQPPGVHKGHQPGRGHRRLGRRRRPDSGALGGEAECGAVQ